MTACTRAESNRLYSAITDGCTSIWEDWDLSKLDNVISIRSHLWETVKNKNASKHDFSYLLALKLCYWH
jgi:hypothetical protein